MDVYYIQNVSTKNISKANTCVAKENCFPSCTRGEDVVERRYFIHRKKDAKMGKCSRLTRPNLPPLDL